MRSWVPPATADPKPSGRGQNPNSSRSQGSASLQLGPSSQSGLTQASTPNYGPCSGYCLYTLFGKPCAKPGESCFHFLNGSRVPLSHDQELKALPPHEQNVIMTHFSEKLKPTLSKKQIKRYGP